MDVSTRILEYLNTRILKYLTAIRHGIRPRIKADYRVIFEKRSPVQLFAEVCIHANKKKFIGGPGVALAILNY